MSFDPVMSAIRFGYGLHPDHDLPRNVDQILAQLDGPDVMAIRYPTHTTNTAIDLLFNYRKALGKTLSADDSKDKTRAKMKVLRQNAFHNLAKRPIASPDWFRERLAFFWTDHFSVSGRSRRLGVLLPAMVDDAIRPNLTGQFVDMLSAVTLHPAMLEYLDQNASIGPNSKFGKRKRERGLNENLAREFLELHTMGVDGAYSQTDVRELAELLTGIRVNGKGVRFDSNFAEPGSEYILGSTYGGQNESQRHVTQFLNDIAVHPKTAHHLARKLAVHFVSDDPPRVLIDAMANEYIKTRGELRSVYSVMLSHDAAWDVPFAKVKQPLDFVISAYRVIGTTATQLDGTPVKKVLQGMVLPMRLMGQDFLQPAGPDGWPEDGAHWITPAGLAGRVQFAMEMSARMNGTVDPRAFISQALGSYASASVRQAATRAETKIEGVALVLASPEFNRR